MDNGSKLIVNRKDKWRRTIRYTIAVTASVLLIVVLIEGYKFYTLSPEKLYAKNYSAYELPATSVSGDSASALEKAYREKKYDEVINLNRNSVLSIQDIFLTGIAYLEKSDFSKAISSFQVVIADAKDDQRAMKDAAEHYLALAYLQNRDYDQAIEQMNEIHNDQSHLYKVKFSRKYINRVKRLKWR
jgi:predicted negative regulator of RcsB-dependent stress response